MSPNPTSNAPKTPSKRPMGRDILYVTVIVLLLTFLSITTMIKNSPSLPSVSFTCSDVHSESNSNETELFFPIYHELYRKALELSAQDFESAHNLGDTGIVIGPVEGTNVERYILTAFHNAKRIRYIWKHYSNDMSKSVKLAIMIGTRNLDEIKIKCKAAEISSNDPYKEVCDLWNSPEKLFDHIIEAKEEYQWNDSGADIRQGSSRYWLKALGGYKHAPYKRTMFLDSDAFPCPGFEYLFNLLTLLKDGHAKRWQVREWEDVDFAAGIDQFPFGTGCKVRPSDDPAILAEYGTFPERNTGTTLFNFHRRSAHTFAHFIPLVSEYIYNHVASSAAKVVNDQCPFRVAMYMFHRLDPDFRDRQLPMHSSCRTYPGSPHAGATDGHLNGMFPLTSNGKHCKDCLCTPCLISHTPVYPVTINGTMGWW